MLKEMKIRSLLITVDSDSGVWVSDDHVLCVLQKNMRAFFFFFFSKEISIADELFKYFTTFIQD